MEAGCPDGGEEDKTKQNFESLFEVSGRVPVRLGRWACMESVRNNVPQVVGSRFAHTHMHTFKLSSKNASTKTQTLCRVYVVADTLTVLKL